MELHHKKHHNTYITNLNNTLETLQYENRVWWFDIVLICCSEAQEQKDVDVILQCQKAIGFHGGGVYFQKRERKIERYIEILCVGDWNLDFC